MISNNTIPIRRPTVKMYYLDMDQAYVRCEALPKETNDFDELRIVCQNRHITSDREYEMSNLVKYIFIKLTDFEKYIIRLRHGFNNEEPHTFKQIAKKLGISLGTAYNKYNQVISKIKEIEGVI